MALLLFLSFRLPSRSLNPKGEKMARTTGPLFSLDASGKVGGALVYSRWKGRSYVRRLVVPANPQSVSQVAMRAMISFLSKQWASLSGAEQATWEELADAISVSPFNAYVQFNQRNWRNFLAPSQAHPAARATSQDAFTNEAATAGVRQITVEGDVGAVEGDNWGVMIFRSLATPITTAWSNCIAIVEGLSNTSIAYVDSPLAPDTYYYNFRCFTADGLLGIEETEVNATVT